MFNIDFFLENTRYERYEHETSSTNVSDQFDSYEVQNQTTIENKHANVSVLVYTYSKMFKDGLRDLMFEGNLRRECKLEFDCFFKQKFNHDITAKFFYSMDAVVVGNEALRHLRELFPFIIPHLCQATGFKFFLKAK